MARRNPMKVVCPKCSSTDVRMSRWRNRVEQALDLFGMPPMRCLDCQHRWRHSLWHLKEALYARCPRCYRLTLSTWDETYYHTPLIWQVMTGLGAKKVRCKACRLNFVSFRLVKNKAEWKASIETAAARRAAAQGEPVSVTELNTKAKDRHDHH